ncbi:hypothetical protein ACE6H2_010611 [Prunus campanulata]
MTSLELPIQKQFRRHFNSHHKPSCLCKSGVWNWGGVQNTSRWERLELCLWRKNKFSVAFRRK